MAVDSLRAHLIEELTDLLDAENQLTRALPKMAAASSTTALKQAFQQHLKETRGHIIRLNSALRLLDEEPSRKTCEAMEGLLAEGEEMMKKATEGALRDAVMITAAQKVEHYEMATYGTVRTYAEVLGESGVARLLQATLREEKAADSKLTAIAQRSVNKRAAEEWRTRKSADGNESGVVERSAEWMGRLVGSASRRFAGTTKRAAESIGVAQDRAARRAAGRKRTTKRGRSARKHRR